jgi:hypothetical protein
MHATYAFLVNTEDDPVGHEDIVRVAQFHDYIEAYGDENNWYQEMMSLKQDGAITQLSPGGDWRGRDSFYESFAEVPQEERWQKGIEFATGCVLYEIKSALDSLYWDETWEVREYPDLSLENAGQLIRETIRDRALVAREYSLKKAAVVLDQLGNMETKPFTKDGANPYESIRAQDLRDYKDESMALVFVDIHT